MRVALSFISSVHFMDLCEMGDIEFCLAHLARDLPRYRAYYRRAVTLGRYVLMDNGTAEGQLVDNDTLLDLLTELGSVEVVAPDVLYDGPATIDATSAFIDALLHIKGHAQPAAVMAVPQGKTADEYVRCAQALAVLPFVGVLGLSKYAVRRCFSTDEATKLVESRVRAIDATQGLGKALHLLGADGSHLQELANLMHNRHRYAAVRSNDSAFAYWSACRGIELKLEPRLAEYIEIGSSDLLFNPDLAARRRAYANAATLQLIARGR